MQEKGATATGVQMPRYSTYYRWIPVLMIQKYKRLQESKSMQARLFVRAINETMSDTERLPDGALRIRAVKMVYIDQTHTAEGAAMKLYVSKSTVKRYLYDFVQEVAELTGFVEFEGTPIVANVEPRQTSKCGKKSIKAQADVMEGQMEWKF